MKAFPHDEFKINSLTVGAQEGMDLRDYFASRMMPRLFDDVIDHAIDFDEATEITAVMCYTMADAMMKARKQ